MLGEIRGAILDQQQVASTNIVSLEETQEINGIDPDQMLRQSRRIRKTIKYVYKSEESENGLVYMVSSQLLRPNPEKSHVQCMLLSILSLNQCPDELGIDPKSLGFNLDRSATGTHSVAMLLPREKHDQMMAKRNVAVQRVERRSPSTRVLKS